METVLPFVPVLPDSAYFLRFRCPRTCHHTKVFSKGFSWSTRLLQRLKRKAANECASCSEQINLFGANATAREKACLFTVKVCLSEERSHGFLPLLTDCEIQRIAER